MDFFNQDIPLRKFLNLTPDINTTGGLHDHWLELPAHPAIAFVNSVGTMRPAAAISYRMPLDGPLSVEMAASRGQ